MNNEQNSIFNRSEEKIDIFSNEKKFKNNIEYSDMKSDLSDANNLLYKGMVSQSKHKQMKKAIFERYEEKFINYSFKLNPILNTVILIFEIVFCFLFFKSIIRDLLSILIAAGATILILIIMINQILLYRKTIKKDYVKKRMIVSCIILTVILVCLAILNFVYFNFLYDFTIFKLAPVLYLIYILLLLLPISVKNKLYKFYPKVVSYQEMLKELGYITSLYNQGLIYKEDFENFKSFFSNLM